MTQQPTCPICGADVPPRKTNKAYPFCSERCRMVDLSKWLDEDYKVPDRAPEDM